MSMCIVLYKSCDISYSYTIYMIFVQDTSRYTFRVHVRFVWYG